MAHNNKQKAENFRGKDNNITFIITFFKADIQKIMKTHKILNNIPTSTRMKVDDINFERIFRASTKDLVDRIHGGDIDLIQELTKLTDREARRFRSNSEENVHRAKKGQSLIETKNIKTTFYLNLVNRFFAAMKRVNGEISLEAFIHTLVIYWCDMVNTKYDKDKARELLLKKTKKEPVKVDGEFKLLKDVIREEQAPQPTEEIATTVEEKEEEKKDDNIDLKIVHLTHRDKKKVIRKINNLVANKEELKDLEEEKETLEQEINKLRLQRDELLFQVNKVKSVLQSFTSDLLDLSTLNEEMAESVNTNDYKIMMMNRIISARKMRNMSTEKQEEYLNSLVG